MKASHLALTCLLLGCSAHEEGPSLLQLTDVSAREVGRGDKLELTGVGFPEGRAARLTFRGDVFRPGRPALRDIEVSIPARTASPHVLEAAIPDELVARMCGRDDGARATFRGDVTAAFSPRKSGAPPVSGSLQGVVLEVEPGHESEQSQLLSSQEGERFAAFLGIGLTAEGAGPLRVQKVEAHGRGADAGLLAGDVLEELSGVRLSSVADFVPPPRVRVARIGLERGGAGGGAVLAVDVAEFRPGTLSDLAPALALVGSALLVLLLALSPFGRFTTWLALAISSRGRGQVATRAGRWLGVARGLSSALPAGVPAYFGVAIASSLLALGALEVPLVAHELDLPILLLGCGSALSVAGFLSQLNQGESFSLLPALRRTLWVVVAQVPLAAALSVGVLSVGSLRADDFASAQAGMPWRFLAFASPIHFAALLLGILSLVPEATLSSSASSSLPRPRAKRWQALSSVEWIHTVIGAGLLSTVLLGGFAVPWLSDLDRMSSTLGAGLGAALLVVKTFVVVISVAVLRWALGRVNVEQCRSALLRAGLPAAIVMPVSAKLWVIAAEGLVLSAYREVLALALFSAAALTSLFILRRLGQNLRLQRCEQGANPWL